MCLFNLRRITGNVDLRSQRQRNSQTGISSPLGGASWQVDWLDHYYPECRRPGKIS